MHIPDGFLDARTCVGTSCVAGAGLAWALRKASARWNEQTVPLLGVLSAFIFAGQMVNFPVAGGTSGHLFGGVLAAVFLGPHGAAVAIATVLLVQCFLFQDGGVTALGANLLNLGLVGVGVGYGTYALIRRFFSGHRGTLAASAVASVLSVVAASVFCSLELAGSGTAPLTTLLPSMVLVHLAIGIGEAVITVSILSFVLKVRGDLLYQADPRDTAPQAIPWLPCLLATIGFAILLRPLASTFPDGLESIAAQFGLTGNSTTTVIPLADYGAPGMPNWLGVSFATTVGTTVAFWLAWGLARLLRRSRTEPDV